MLVSGGCLQSLVKVLEMCKAVMEALAGAGYALTDYEAALFLPAVVEKSGHNQVGGRGGLRCVPTPSEKREMRTRQACLHRMPGGSTRGGTVVC